MGENKEKNAYCFVFTPLGYLNAKEFINEENGSYEEKILLRITTSISSGDQLDKIIESGDWDQKFNLYRQHSTSGLGKIYSTWSMITFSMRLRIFLRKISSDDDVIISHIDNPYSRMIIRYLTAKKTRIIIVDDGLVTISDFRKLASTGNLKESNRLRGRLRSPRAIIEKLLFPHHDINASDVHFYSMFPLQDIDNPCGANILSRNRLKSVNNKIKNQIIKNHVYFVGQPFIHSGRVSKDQYNNLLSKISEYYGKMGMELFYIPHRNESEDDIENGIKLLNLNEPIETYLVGADEIPKFVSGFSSTCLLTLNYIFRDKINFEFFWGFQSINLSDWDPGGIIPFMREQAKKSDSILINEDLSDD